MEILKKIPRAATALAIAAVLGGTPAVAQDGMQEMSRSSGRTVGEANRAYCKEDISCYAARNDLLGVRRLINDATQEQKDAVLLSSTTGGCDRQLAKLAIENGANINLSGTDKWGDWNIRNIIQRNCNFTIDELASN